MLADRLGSALCLEPTVTHRAQHVLVHRHQALHQGQAQMARSQASAQHRELELLPSVVRLREQHQARERRQGLQSPESERRQELHQGLGSSGQHQKWSRQLTDTASTEGTAHMMGTVLVLGSTAQQPEAAPVLG